MGKVGPKNYGTEGYRFDSTDIPPRLDKVERAALGFLVQNLNQGCKIIQVDAFDCFLSRYGASLRTVAVIEYFSTLGLLEKPTFPRYPILRDAFGELSGSEIEALAAYDLQRAAALNQCVITGSAIKLFKLVTATEGALAQDNKVLGKKAKPPRVPDKYSRAVKLWGTFKTEKTNERKRPSMKMFREWLLRRPNPILLDANYENWWNQIYSPQLRRSKK